MPYDIFWGEYEGTRCSMKDFLLDTEEIEIYSSKVKVLTIKKAFIQLILHHYKEMNSIYHLSHYNCIRTNMFCDIYDMLRLKKEVLSIYTTKKLCTDYKIGNIVYYMLYYTNQVCKNNFLKDYINALENGYNCELINSYGLCACERKKWNIPFNDRINNDYLWNQIRKEMTDADWQKIKAGNNIFT